MKLKLLSMVLVLFLAGAGDSCADDIAFAGVNYEGNYGVFFGIGHAIGPISTWPYARFSIDSTVQDELRLTKSVGVETIVWLYQTAKFKAGLLASPLNLDWIDNQEQSVGTYWSQSVGFGFHWQVSEQFGLTGLFKGKTQLFSSGTIYPDDITAGIALSTKKFW